MERALMTLAYVFVTTFLFNNSVSAKGTDIDVKLSAKLFSLASAANHEREAFNDLIFRAILADNNPSFTQDQVIANPKRYTGKAKWFTGKIVELSNGDGYKIGLVLTPEPDGRLWVVMSAGDGPFKEMDIVDTAGFISGVSLYSTRDGRRLRLPIVMAMGFMKSGEIRKIGIALLQSMEREEKRASAGRKKRQ
jgi:hypothetical protein